MENKNKGGRPQELEEPTRVTFRLSQADKKLMDDLAAREGVNRSQLLRLLLNEKKMRP
ncbi:ribbon-helix-helix domain-containing protein [Mechercharimyces sp. CAU 1602]|uniref:ribbon-helix-helix domain-containing protein n=1 Tax=Mechercharimyces sp. CAU 1602 TaxID=2973933 RepID=UPI0021616954|nr:ribbon-helix-helix domain-containing protein [Mechercharimyces sp. CAU 1602]MCS1352801.1 ribbon-helix-helix domain-containing protein [Mechercharimyces sp. CAU 1602]